MNDFVTLNFDQFIANEDGEGGISIPLEKEPCRGYNYTQSPPQNFFYPQEVEAAEHSTYSIGETLWVNSLENKMVAMSFKNTDATADGYKIRRKNRYNARVVCNGTIIKCVKQIYDNKYGDEFYYTITTKGHDNNICTFEISHKDFEENLFSVLLAKGRLDKMNYCKEKDTAELMRNFITASAENMTDTFMYNPGWKNGKFMYVDEKHEAFTPFFQNIIYVDKEGIPESKALREMLKMLEICKNSGNRLFFLLLSVYIVLRDLFPDVLKFNRPFSINISKKFSKLPENLLNIFDNVNGISSHMTDNPDKIEFLKECRTGTVFFSTIQTA